METSVFKVIRNLESFELSGLPAKVLKRFTDFIESGSFRKNEFDKFICKNFRLSYEEIIRRWNCLHPDDCKVENTARGTKSLIGSYLISLLGIDLKSFNDIFVLNDEEALKDLAQKIIVLEGGDFNPYKRFSFNIFESIGEEPAGKEFEIAECAAELEFLKAVDYTSIYGQLQRLDVEKIRYLLEILQKPLVHKQRAGTKTVPELNVAKVKICTALIRSRGRELSSKKFNFEGKVE